MENTETKASDNEAKPAKPAVDPALLERLAKAREAAAAKRKAIAEQKKLAAEHLNAAKKQPEPPAEESDIPARKQTSKEQTRPKKEKDIASSSESDSSTDSSDTSDSEASFKNKRMKKSRRVRTKKDYQLELAKAKEKYQSRYKTRYELLARSIAAPPAPVEHAPVNPPVAEGSVAIRRAATRAAKDDVRMALHKEMVASAMKNLFGTN